jgi:DNA-binding MurR/RpiR family transcriptional regulator
MDSHKSKTEQQGDTLHQIQLRLVGASPQFQKVGRAVLREFDRTVFMTARELAEFAGTSEATVGRFAKSCGFAGYPEFQTALQRQLRQDLLPKERLRRAGPMPSSIEALVDRVVESNLENIEEFRRLLEAEDLGRAAKMLVGARSKYVIGMRSSASVAYLLGHYLRLAMEDVQILTNGGPTLFEELLSVKQTDVVIAVSFPRFTILTVDGLRYARERGAKTIAITDSRTSPAAQIADVALVAPGQSIGFGNSYVAPVLIVDTLIAAIVSLDPDRALARLDMVESAFDGNDFFYGDRSMSTTFTNGRATST